MPTSPRELLQHILDECAFVAGKVAMMSREGFLADETAKRALVRSLEIIGQAARNLPEAFRTQYSSVDWRVMAGMRDDDELVGDAATARLPGLRQRLERILADASPDHP